MGVACGIGMGFIGVAFMGIGWPAGGSMFR